MLKMERKGGEGEKLALVFKRMFADPPEIVAVLELEDAVDVAAFLVEDFSDYHLSDLLRKLPEKDRGRIWEQLYRDYENEMPVLRDVRRAVS